MECEVLMYYCCGISNVGNTRSHNEDAFLINKIVMSHAQMESNLSEPFIVGVADGVAGEKSGEIASKLCLELLSNIKFSKTTNIKRKIMTIHENLRAYGMTHDNSINMQTTLCALAVDEENVAYSINIGDSRMYTFSSGQLTQITKDQSLVQLLYDAGQITNAEKREHSKRNIIFPVLGNLTSPPCPDIKKIGIINPNELIIICSDGLSDYATTEEIEDVLSQKTLLTKRLSSLVDLALEKGSKDNITIVAVSVNEE